MTDAAYHNPVFAALDTASVAEARGWAAAIGPHVGGLKLGLEFVMANGPGPVAAIAEESGKPVFLDVKLHDIPNTVAGAMRSLGTVAPAFVTIHAGGGAAMIGAAREAAEATAVAGQRTRILAVTVLTSLDSADLAALGQDDDPGRQVERLARLAIDAGADGLVCAPTEIARLRSALGPDAVLMVPGIRPAWAGSDDQKRVMTPAEAVAAGASHIVIGRPITRADDPALAALRIAVDLGLT
ncbi:MAG: orotidine-5'-phosphate decarboxylase [Azospirillaceae bacterium]